MDKPPRLTDRSALARNRARATDLFLHETAWDDLHERLQVVNRTFTAPAVVSGFPEFWAEKLPSAKHVPDAETLDLDEAAHDLVVHAMCLHWADDPIGQLVQCRRALKPDGLLLVVMFGGQTLSELRACLADAETRITGGLSPRVLPMAEVRDLGGLLQRAGLALPVADNSTLTATYETMFHLMKDLRGMGESNAMDGRQKVMTPRAVFASAAQTYAQSYAMDDGRIPATFELITLTGWAPSEDQPQPLKPGSATHRLADVLGTSETKLNKSKD